jgi:hypothetical protein
MNNKRFKLTLVLILICSTWVLIGIWAELKEDGTACLVDPLKYAVDSEEQINQITVSFKDPNLLPTIITKEGRTYIPRTPEGEEVQKLNISLENIGIAK